MKKVKLSPVFSTKEQEEEFSKCAKESMYSHMTNVESNYKGKQKTL